MSLAEQVWFTKIVQGGPAEMLATLGAQLVPVALATVVRPAVPAVVVGAVQPAGTCRDICDPELKVLLPPGPVNVKTS